MSLGLPTSSHYFVLTPEHAPAGRRPLAAIQGQHRWTLPTRIGCPECGVYTAVGPAHPAVDLAGWPGEDALRTPSAASWRQFRELAERLAPAVGDVVLAPGTELGPFAGDVQGGPADFVLGPIHLLFVTPGAHARLTAAGLPLPPAVPADLRARGRAPAEWWEFDVPRGGRLAAAGYDARAASPCATCGRWQRTLRRPWLEPGSAPPAAPLLRPLNHPTVLLASAPFVAAVRAAELTGLAFEPADADGADA